MSPSTAESFQVESLEAAEHLLVRIDDGKFENDNVIDRYSNGGEIKLEIKQLRKLSDKGVCILDGVDLRIPRGKIVGIIGPSGSGKSTVLKALNRLWEPPTGSVYLDGRDVCDIDVLSVRRRVGMLFQLPALFQGTVADNVRYGPKLKGKKLSDEQVQRLLSIADLDHTFIDKNWNELSVGQQQRVALARTLANEPEVLLLDEPTSALDPISTQNIEDALVKLKTTKGMTVIMVSHSVRQVQRVADIVCLLVNGVVVEVLPPNQLCDAKHPMALRFLELSS
ncbi:ABC transporter I family member 17-like isoform X1 [Amaranthus tricolor]|uniref:ABC transporter I family member 17-like isoform X1 n=1 Tax=Amaranthus tricolor TaxID=29722 RepID=UPI002582980C|nr:ABC transporter I family member 17-like isoform X1 [Amaranthus tricolor]